jgi:5-methyltetrahydropteroyltriglutamate--homocysteine methyltransferase
MTPRPVVEVRGAPAIRTTVVGSYPVPSWLAAFPSEEALVDAMRAVFGIQALAGIDVVADGELHRFDIHHPDTNGMIDYFTRRLSGVRTALGRTDLEEFAGLAGMAFRAEPAGAVEGPVGEGTLDLPREYRRARALTAQPLKFTLTGPHMLAKTLIDRHYRDPAALALAVAGALAAQVRAIDADVLQVDEANISGHPGEAEWAAAAANAVLDAAVLAKEKGVHVCFGNYGGQPIQKGTWKGLIGYLNRLHADHLVLEFAFRGYEELSTLRDELDPRLGIGVGVIDVKANVVEAPDLVARRIEGAVKALGPGRVRWVHPDCGFWMLKRSVADRKMAALVQGRDAFLGRAPAANPGK